jgi:hypothetical protein
MRRWLSDNWFNPKRGGFSRAEAERLVVLNAISLAKSSTPSTDQKQSPKSLPEHRRALCQAAGCSGCLSRAWRARWLPGS